MRLKDSNKSEIGHNCTDCGRLVCVEYYRTWSCVCVRDDVPEEECLNCDGTGRDWAGNEPVMFDYERAGMMRHDGQTFICLECATAATMRYPERYDVGLCNREEFVFLAENVNYGDAIIYQRRQPKLQSQWALAIQSQWSLAIFNHRATNHVEMKEAE